MLNVSHAFADALSETSERKRKAAFMQWVAAVPGLPRAIPSDEAARAYDESLPEARRAGIDTDQRLFDYILARILMPDIDGLQYVLALEVIFSDSTDGERIAQLLTIAEQHRG